MYPMYETMACAFRMEAYAALAIVLTFRLILSMIDFLMVVFAPCVPFFIYAAGSSGG